MPVGPGSGLMMSMGASVEVSGLGAVRFADTRFHSSHDRPHHVEVGYAWAVVRAVPGTRIAPALATSTTATMPPSWGSNPSWNRRKMRRILVDPPGSYGVDIGAAVRQDVTADTDVPHARERPPDRHLGDHNRDGWVMVETP